MVSSKQNSSPLRGVCTVVYEAEDFDGAKKWYAELFGVEPYFDTPPYAEFRIGDYEHEFGILNSKFAAELGGERPAKKAPAGVITYWHVDDIDAALDRLTELGAKIHQPKRAFNDGDFVGASVIDPFGNILGVMFNPHYREQLAGDRKAA
jgi:predicted enzyme related to lactoylglutathione lyase